MNRRVVDSDAIWCSRCHNDCQSEKVNAGAYTASRARPRVS
jgi:hypothetical protein